MSRATPRLSANVVTIVDGRSVPVAARGSTLPRFLRAVERAALEGALQATGGHNTHAAELLGVTRRHFQQRLVVHGLGAFGRELRDARRERKAS